jgi:hypothetical protein
MVKERGSDVLRRLHGDGPIKHVEGLFQLVDDLGLELKIRRWHPIGVPPATLALEGVFEVSSSSVGGLVDRLINDEQLAANIRVFPIGVPVEDLAIVEYRGVAHP